MSTRPVMPVDEERVREIVCDQLAAFSEAFKLWVYWQIISHEQRVSERQKTES